MDPDQCLAARAVARTPRPEIARIDAFYGDHACATWHKFGHTIRTILARLWFRFLRLTPDDIAWPLCNLPPTPPCPPITRPLRP